MKYSFTCCGHGNITARHKTTLEFTKDKDLGLEGDCIAGVWADFQLNKIKQFIKKLPNNKITIIIEPINEEYNNKDSNKNKTNDNSIINNDSNKKKINNEINNINNQIKNNNNKNTINRNNIEKNKGIDKENSIKSNDDKIIEKINAEINPNFNSDNEMVIRKTDFISERTFAIRADKAAFELSRGLVGLLNGKENKIRVIVENML